MDTKICVACPENGPQPLDNFAKQSGCSTRYNKCKACRNKERRAWRAERKGTDRDRDAAYAREHLPDFAKWKAIRVAELIEWVNEMKSKPCMDCGNTLPPVCMDFDHVRGGKVMSITRMVHGASSRDRILGEIAKCDLVCSNCHRIRTWLTGREMPWYDKLRKHTRT